jgi:hypothetical protein
MTVSKFAPSRVRKNMPVMDKLAAYWRENWEQAFPDLLAGLIGWGEPFCFRCGWLAPMPGSGRSGSWSDAAGWLERAHLRDHMTGGGNEPANIVPLCTMCHRAMPDFVDSRDEAIDWVRRQRHKSCLDWWQARTDALWGGEGHVPFPGRMVFINVFTQSSERRSFADQAAECLLSGDYGQARSLLRLADVSDETISGLFSQHAAALAVERESQ